MLGDFKVFLQHKTVPTYSWEAALAILTCQLSQKFHGTLTLDIVDEYTILTAALSDIPDCVLLTFLSQEPYSSTKHKLKCKFEW